MSNTAYYEAEEALRERIRAADADKVRSVLLFLSKDGSVELNRQMFALFGVIELVDREG
jgi:hypothetical protein